MKLYQTYKKIVERIRPIEVGWFTTFNLDLQLLEKFLLPVIADKEPSEMKTAEDFEALNTELRGKKLCVWYDYRALDISNEKYTTIDLFPVNPSEIYGKPSTSAVFHPKVIFLKGEKEAYLITGSANLSIAAWSSNTESVIARKIETQRNAIQVLSLFEGLGRSETRLQKWAESLKKKSSDWDFIHNFNEVKPLPELLSGSSELTIWSPYYSNKTLQLLKSFSKFGFKKFELIPDINVSGKIRITPSEISNLAKAENILLLRTSGTDDADRFNHSKVWLSPDKLAIGSWNCTRHATGVGVPEYERNIEAGIITGTERNTYRSLKASLSELKANQTDGIESDELQKEWESVLSNYTVCIEIEADWSEFTYRVFDEEIDGDYFVSLPHDRSERFPLQSVNGMSFRANYRKVLKDKSFVVFDKSGKEVYHGFLLEDNKDRRPVYGYVSLIELFESLVQNPSGETVNKKVNYHLEEEEDQLIGSYRESVFNYKGSHSYYLMFVSFQKLFDKILESASDPIKLDSLGFRLPGSLLKITELVNESLEKAITEKDEDSLLFHWYLINELNRCITEFNVHSENELQTIDTRTLNELLQFDEQDRKFISKINQSFGYGT